MRKEKMGMENGRTMAEMLAVISLAGVLSITGIVGYGYAMRLYQEAETMDQLSVLIAGARSWDIPLHFGQKTVGVSDDYRPYVVPIRDVISRVNFRTEMSAYEAGLTDDEGNLIKDTMGHVREYESFNTLLDAPAWVRAEDEFNWSVRVTGLSYSLCEKLLNKSDLGFDYAYVALQNPNSQMPLDPIMGDFSGVDNANKYANPAKEIEGGISTKEQIEKVCALLDPSKGSIPPAQTYIRNIDNEEKTTVASGTAEGVCRDKKSLGCMAAGARIYNEKTKQVDQPLQTLVLYFGSGDDMPIYPPGCVGDECWGNISTCLKGTPYTEESGGKIENEKCCQLLGGTYFIPGVPKCCRVVGDVLFTPRCELTPSGLYAIDVLVQRDVMGRPLTDSKGNILYYEKTRLMTSSITAEASVFLKGDWTGRSHNACCDAVKESPTTFQCHQSSINKAPLPWVIDSTKGTTSAQHQNCPHSVSAQTSNITSEGCCTGSGEYWSEAEGTSVGTVLSSDTGQALCCSKNSIFDYHAVSTPDQCPWEPVSNIPLTANPLAGAEPKDMYGTNTTDCCYKQVGKKGILKNSACAYEGGTLKYSASCCNISTDAVGNKLKYVYAPYVGETHTYAPTFANDNNHPISQECGAVSSAPTSVSEPDRNCCVDYIEAEKKTPLDSDTVIKDWSGMPSPQYCCKTLIGTTFAPNEREMKRRVQQCCESELYFDTEFKEMRRKGKFIPAGTRIRVAKKNVICPAPYIGETCGLPEDSYITEHDTCCEIHTGKDITGVDSEICCDWLSMSSGRYSTYWDEATGKCLPCGSCKESDESDDEKCYDYCSYQVLPTNRDPHQDTTPPTVTTTCDTTKGCWIGSNNACCQIRGYDADGQRTCNCCDAPNSEGVRHGDACFFLKDTPSYMDPKPECFKVSITPGTTTPGTTTPGVTTPGVTVPITVQKTVRTYDCPEGVAPGTGRDIGWCESGNTSGGAE